jgi:uncharacterized membrane protein YbhN (UPF0104 family)
MSWSRGSRWKVLRRWVGFVIVGIIFFFLGRHLYGNWNAVKVYAWEFDLPYLVLSFICVISTFVFLVWLWRSLLAELGSRLSFRSAFRIWFLSSLGRYVPGKVWQLLGMVYLSQREGVPVERSTASALLVQALSAVPGVLLCVSVLTFHSMEMAQKMVWLLLVIPPALALAYPPVLERVVSILSRRLGGEEIHFAGGTSHIVRFMFYYGVGWFMYGLSFMLFVRSVASVPASAYILVTGIFSGAYLLGLFSLFVPGGLGIREGVLAFLLSLIFPLPVATAISLGSRIWMTAAEILCVGISLRL